MDHGASTSPLKQNEKRGPLVPTLVPQRTNARRYQERGISPTYLSKVERDEFSPPAEDKVSAIAPVIECDADDLLARAGRVPSDLTQIIKDHPREMAILLRGTVAMSEEERAEVIKGIAEKMKQRKTRSF